MREPEGFAMVSFFVGGRGNEGIVDLLCGVCKSAWTFSDVGGQAPREKISLAHTGADAFFVQYFRRWYGNLGGDVSVSSQDQALVFCVWDAAHFVAGGVHTFGFCQAELMKSIINCYRCGRIWD